MAPSIRSTLKAIGTPERAAGAQRFFKTGKGEYGEGDVFLGVTVPEQRKIATQFATLTLDELAPSLRSKLHEERLVALLILVRQFTRAKKDPAAQQRIIDFYLAHTAYVNNWDLVDSSAHQLLGEWLRTRDRKILRKLAKSSSLWERRIAMVATYAFIRAGEHEDACAIAELLLGDEHDLIHKAVGWMLREIGKHIDKAPLRAFLDEHAATMPRTALRYAIEHLPVDERKRWLAVKATR